MAYTDADIAGFNEADLRVFWWSPQRQDWDLVPAAHDPANNLFTHTTTATGLYTLGAVMPAGEITWTVQNATVTAGPDGDITTVALVSSTIGRNDGGMTAPGTLVHVRPVTLSAGADFDAETFGTVLTADAAPAIEGTQVALGTDGRAHVTIVLPGRHTTIRLQSFTDIGTAVGSAAIQLPQ